MVRPVVRLVGEGDRRALSEMLARAFHDDPVSVWSQPGARLRPRRIRHFFDARLRTLVPHELSWTTDDLAGAALWAPPDAWEPPPGELLRALPSTFGRRMPFSLAGAVMVESRHPRETHLYLSVIGVEPSRQGAGLGSRLLTPGLELCDREGVPAYLETATERNVAFYERHGFRVTGELRLPRGPLMWLMWREPR